MFAIRAGRALIAVSELSNRAIATSGDYEQFISIGGHRYSHILDPRSGEPASGLTSVTVLSARAVDSDALATALFVMGSDDGMELVESLPGVEALFIAEDGSAISSSGLRLEDGKLAILEFSTRGDALRLAVGRGRFRFVVRPGLAVKREAGRLQAGAQRTDHRSPQ